MKRYNELNTHYNELKKEYNAMDETSAKAYHLQKILEDVKTISEGGFCYCFNWEQVEDVLNCFNYNDNFDIREKSGIFYIQGECGTAQKKKFTAAYEGRLDEAEREKPSGR